MLVEMPAELRAALETLTNAISPQRLNRAVAELSVRYREDRPSGESIAHSREDTLAYAAYRFPATYAAVVAALAALQEQRPDWRPRSLLDLGSGSGAGLWAAIRVWPGIERITAVDAESSMMAAGKSLALSARHPALKAVEWRQADLNNWQPHEACDLVLLSYVLGEIDPSTLTDLIERAWRASGEALVIVEPGTPPGYRRVREAREIIRASSGHAIAPCPHDPPCEVPHNDWMHFSVRVPRTRLHRGAKGAELGYEDEKFSYVALSRTPIERDYNRILRHPQTRKGHVYLQLCTARGVQTVVVSKRDGELYHRARKASWGDVFDLPEEKLG